MGQKGPSFEDQVAIQERGSERFLRWLLQAGGWSVEPAARGRSSWILAFSLFRPLCSGSNRRPASAAVQASLESCSLTRQHRAWHKSMWVAGAWPGCSRQAALGLGGCQMEGPAPQLQPHPLDPAVGGPGEQKSSNLGLRSLSSSPLGARV